MFCCLHSRLYYFLFEPNIFLGFIYFQTFWMYCNLDMSVIKSAIYTEDKETLSFYIFLFQLFREWTLLSEKWGAFPERILDFIFSFIWFVFVKIHLKHWNSSTVSHKLFFFSIYLSQNFLLFMTVFPSSNHIFLHACTSHWKLPYYHLTKLYHLRMSIFII